VLNHLGRHELHGYFEPNFDNDPNLTYFNSAVPRFNPNTILNIFQIKEDPLQGGRYVGVDAPEFGTHAAGQIIRLDAPPTQDADHIGVTYATKRVNQNEANHPGLFREPLPLAGGQLVAVHTNDSGEESGNNVTNSSYEFQLKTLKQGGDSYWVADQLLTSGITKTISYWSPDVMVTYSGPLWELNPVEVRQRPAPPFTQHPPLAGPEQQMFAQAGVDVGALQAYLVQNNLALIISRDVTTRDDADTQQPFNLRVPNGVQSTGKSGKIYDITHLQIFQADQLRGWTGCCGDEPLAGRRVLAQYLHDPAAVTANPVLSNAPKASVALATDGSYAAFVPARRAMTWQLTDAQGNGVVRERYWLTFQPGEIRMCASCHGLSEKDQAGRLAPTNAPKALLDLLVYWKGQTGGNPVPTLTPTATPGSPTGNPTPTPTLIPTQGPGNSREEVYLPVVVR
jgi:hypothetical protein